MQTTIDRAGRMVIPKAVRESAGIQPGVELSVLYRDGKIEIEPVQRPLRWVRKGSLTVAVAPPGSPPSSAATLFGVAK